MNNIPVLELREVTRSFRQADSELHILKGISLSVMPGEIVALVGASGAGKSTLLQIAGLLEPPTDGEVIIRGVTATRLNDDKRTAMRRDDIGFVYQFHHLLPEFTALENIAIPRMIKGIAASKAQEDAIELLNSMGLSDRAHHRPSHLSGGEQQRVAILRALSNKPCLLLADEPTGNLDEATSSRVFDELISVVRSHRMGALIVTHDPDLAKRMDKIYRLCGGHLQLYQTSDGSIDSWNK